jgi:trigger factor
MTHKISKEKNSKVEIEISIPKDEFMAYWDRGFKALQKEVELDGFRKGMAPENAIIAKYGEMAILNEMANIAINETYPKIVIEEKLKVISEPHIHLLKLARNEEFAYHAHVEVYPEITLPDYKAIAKEALKDKKETPETTDEEVKQVMDQLDEKVKSETPDLENKIKENMKFEKEMYEKSRVRNLMLEKLVEAISKDSADIFPEKFENKDKAQIIVLEIAKKENISATEEEVETQKMQVMMYMSQSGQNEKVDEVRLTSYAEQVVINEKVMDLLEKSAE